MTVKLNANNVGNLIQTQYSGNVSVASDGTISVDPRDVPSLLAAGCTYVNNDTRFYSTPGAPAAANAALLYASGAASNGTLAVAAQPDQMRPAQAVFLPGTSAVTAGTLTLTYVANDGTTETDVFSLVTAASTNVTANTTKGVVTMTTMVIAGLVGGASPTIEIGTTGVLALPIPANAVDLTLLREYNDNAAQATPGTLAANGLMTPHVAPNGTHTFGFGYSYTFPTA